MEKDRKQCLKLCQVFLSQTPKLDEEIEMEVRFHTKSSSSASVAPILTQLDYERVIRKLRSLGFYCENLDGETTLKIQPQTPKFRELRIEIMGLKAVQEYCRTNDLYALMSSSKYGNQVKIRIKKEFIDKNEDKQDNKAATTEAVAAAEYDAFGFRITLMKEKVVSVANPVVKELVELWAETKKTFRYMNRVSFRPQGGAVQMDLSIVRHSNYQASYYTFGEAKIMNKNPVYEMEIEVLPKEARIKFGTNAEKMRQYIEENCLIVMSGIQGTNTPISYVEQSQVLREYMVLLFPEEAKKDPNFPRVPIRSKDFIGPSSRTLQIKHLKKEQVPNILENFMVTEKADGERNLLFISSKGKIYYINTNMQVMFSGNITKQPKCFRSLADGEFILHDKLGNYISKMMLFDMYYIAGVDIRSHPFITSTMSTTSTTIKATTKATTKANDVTRYQILTEFVSEINMMDKIQAKNFYGSSDSCDGSCENIFSACEFVLTRKFAYHTDGLIFTPQRLGVGATREREAGPLKKMTWEYSFKWKPASQNTIDFLISTEKDARTGKDKIYHQYDASLGVRIFKKLILCCGYDPKRDGYLHPCQDIIEDKLPSKNLMSKTTEKGNDYQAVPFYPTDPADRQAGFAHVFLKDGEGDGEGKMKTEQGQVMTDKMIVEFRYDNGWIPLKVRYDKTADFRQGNKNFGNAFTVANDNWYSIHHPITPEMISTGKGIPDLSSEEVYYSLGTGEKRDLTQGLRNFHNLFVKTLLIHAVSKPGDNLLDLACGKGGDLPKWISRKLSFVLGIDISKDNLENRLDGACARFLNYCKEYIQPPIYMLFIQGNTAQNIRDLDACLTDTGKQIIQAVMEGRGFSGMGEGIKRQLGKGQEGFQVVSCQFAIHYFFQSAQTFYGFLRNVAENTKLGGYFIATCYDGHILYKKLWQTPQLVLYDNDQKMWEITKEYDAPSKDFPGDDNSLGLKIQVYQSSIGQSLPEWLVSLPFLVSRMKEFGLELITHEQAKHMNPLLSSGTGTFEELYQRMNRQSKQEIKKNYGKAGEMTPQEKEISFLNRYFIFQKIRTLDAKKLVQHYYNTIPSTSSTTLVAPVPLAPLKIKKLNKKIKMVEHPHASA